MMYTELYSFEGTAATDAGKTESTLNPLDNATRAEAATIFYRFVKANLISMQN